MNLFYIYKKIKQNTFYLSLAIFLCLPILFGSFSLNSLASTSLVPPQVNNKTSRDPSIHYQEDALLDLNKVNIIRALAAKQVLPYHNFLTKLIHFLPTGTYLYMEASGHSFGKKARLISPTFDLGKAKPCLV